MSQTCTKCSSVNPDDASYCYHDGSALAGHSANGGPVNAGSQPFPNQFVFPSGQRCLNFDQLATACQHNWAEAVGLLKKGFLSSFLGGLGRADLALAAQEAARFPDQDRGLDQLLDKLPTHVLEKPKLLVEPSEVNLGVVQVGGDRHFELHLANQGMRLLYGSVVSDCKWLTLGESPGAAQKLFQFGSDTTIPVQVRGQHLRAGNKALEGHLVIESNGSRGGAVTVTVRAEVPVKPFKEGVLAGATTPRQIAEKAKVAPKDAAALFEKGAVSAWFKDNGWTYPVQGPSASGLGAVQQFFEALGLATAPKVEVTQKSIELRGDPGQVLQAQIEVKTQEKRPVYAHGTSDQTWLDLGKTNLNGRVAVVQVVVTVPNRPGETLQARATIQANGNQRFVIPVTLQVGRGTSFIGNLKPVQSAYVQPVMAATPAPVVYAVTPEPVVAALPVGGAFNFDNEPVVHAIAVPADHAPMIPLSVGGRHRRSQQEDTPLWIHLIPAVLLLLCLLGVILRDLIFTTPVVVENDVDPTPKLAIYFDGSGVSRGRALRSSMTFGLVVINPRNKKDADKKLTFDEFGFTNSTVMQVDNVTRRFGSGGDGSWKAMAAEPGGEWKGKKSIFILHDQVYVTQIVELVPGDLIEVGPKEFKRYLDTCRIRYILENKDRKEHKVGLRMMIDTLIGKDALNDGVPFMVPGKNELVKIFDANEKNGDVIPNFIQVVEVPDLKNPGIVGYFNLKLGDKIQAPTRVSLTHWPKNNIYVWDVPIAPIAEDSCVVLYWKEETLKPGAKREIGFSYGLGDLAAKSGQLAITVGGVKQPGQELTVTALVQGLKAGDTVTLGLPDGLNLKEGSKLVHTLTKTQANQNQVPITWSIEATRNGTFDIEVTTSTGVTQKRRIAIRPPRIF